MPAAILVGPEARHDVKSDARHRDEAPEDGNPANLLVRRHFHVQELSTGPDEPAPPEASAGPDDDQLDPHQTPVVPRELGAGGIDASRPGMRGDVPPVHEV